MTMTTINLHGSLKKYGDSFDLDVGSTAEAIRGLSSQLKGFKEDLKKSNWQLVKNGNSIGQEDLSVGFGKAQHATIDVVPAVGGGKGGAGKIIGGAALITASYFTGGLAAGASGLLATAAHAGVAIGVSMMLSGTSQLLTKTPKKNDDSNKNYNFSGPVNTSGQGSAVPKVIGLRVITGSVVASAQITTE